MWISCHVEPPRRIFEPLCCFFCLREKIHQKSSADLSLVDVTSSWRTGLLRSVFGPSGQQRESETIKKKKFLHEGQEVMSGVGWKLIFLSRCVSVFVVWFLWNNLIKVAGWLNSQRKLGYICLSFPLKSLFPPSDAPSRSHFHHLVIIWKGRGARAARKLPLSHYFCNYFSGCQKIRPNHNPKKKKKKGKCYCLIGFWSGGASSSSFKRRLKDVISFTAAFKGLFHLRGFFFWHNSHVDVTGCDGAMSAKVKHIRGREESTFTTKNIRGEAVV